MESQRRGVKVLILLVAAIVAIGGTIVTSIVQASYQTRIDDANIHHQLIEEKISQSNLTLQRAVQYYQHGAIIQMDRRAYYGIARQVGVLGYDSVYQLQLIWNRNAPESQNALTRDLASVPANPCGVVWNSSSLQDLVLAQNCYLNLLANRQHKDQQRIDQLKRVVTRLAVVATVLQLLGIGIAFAKDLL
ncbi:MAG TPA: hypothetical protein VIW73_13705 [Candidatus Cybelea sp.]